MITHPTYAPEWEGCSAVIYTPDTAGYFDAAPAPKRPALARLDVRASGHSFASSFDPATPALSECSTAPSLLSDRSPTPEGMPTAELTRPLSMPLESAASPCLPTPTARHPPPVFAHPAALTPALPFCEPATPALPFWDAAPSPALSSLMRPTSTCLDVPPKTLGARFRHVVRRSLGRT
jgi:hypothetical protein